MSNIVGYVSRADGLSLLSTDNTGPITGWCGALGSNREKRGFESAMSSNGISSAWCRWRDSNAHCPRLKRVASCRLGYTGELWRAKLVDTQGFEPRRLKERRLPRRAACHVRMMPEIWPKAGESNPVAPSLTLGSLAVSWLAVCLAFGWHQRWDSNPSLRFWRPTS
jgi:hypothetical protein